MGQAVRGQAITWQAVTWKTYRRLGMARQILNG